MKSDITPFMPFVLKASPNLLPAAAFLGLLSVPMTIRAEPPPPDPEHAAPVEAQFRGCESAGWCRFWIEPLDPLAESLQRVRPDGVSRMPGDDAISIAVRDRLNALLANMIHQYKRIVLHDLRELDDGTFAAMVTVNGANVASDPLLLELQKKGGIAWDAAMELPAGVLGRLNRLEENRVVTDSCPGGGSHRGRKN